MEIFLRWRLMRKAYEASVSVPSGFIFLKLLFYSLLFKFFSPLLVYSFLFLRLPPLAEWLSSSYEFHNIFFLPSAATQFLLARLEILSIKFY